MTSYLGMDVFIVDKYRYRRPSLREILARVFKDYRPWRWFDDVGELTTEAKMAPFVIKSPIIGGRSRLHVTSEQWMEIRSRLKHDD